MQQQEHANMQQFIIISNFYHPMWKMKEQQQQHHLYAGTRCYINKAISSPNS